MRVTGKLIILLFTLCVVLSSHLLTAQEMIFSTEVNAEKIGLDDALQVTYSIKNAGNVSRFIPSSFDGFKVIAGPMQSNSVNIINGNMSSATNITYIIKPIQTGTLTVPGAKAVTEGNTIKSNPVTVTVVKGSVLGQIKPKSQQPQKKIVTPFDDESFPNPFDDPFFKRFFGPSGGSPGQPGAPPKKQIPSQQDNITREDVQKKIFAKIDVSKNNAYLGEPIVVTYNVYSQLPLSINPLMPTGSPKGFWVKDVPLDPNAYKERKQINGKEYVVIPVMKFAVIPTQAGTLSLDSFVVQGVAESQSSNEGGMSGFFEDFFKTANDEIPFQAEGKTINIEVKNLPEIGKPSNFSGAVGNFTIESNIDKTELTTDQTLAVNYTVRGNGNINMMGAPIVGFPEAFQSFEPKLFDTITQVGSTMSGYKTYSFLLTPRQTGVVEIPQATFSFFDPETKEYKTIKAPAYNIKIKPGSNFDNMVADNKLNDIHDIENTEPLRIHFASPLPEKPIYWALLAMPLIAMAGAALLKKRQGVKEKIKKENNINKTAQRIARQRLDAADKYLQQKDYTNFYSATSKAIWLYLSDKLNIPISKLNKAEVVQRLQSLQVDQSIQDSIFDTIQTCETALYANINDAESTTEVFKKAIDNISKLEEKLA